MTRLWFILVGMMMTFQVLAQVGITGVYDQLQATDFELVDGSEALEDDPTMVAVEIGAWFRLKKVRLEFLPALYYGVSMDDTELSYYGFRTHAVAYPLDFKEDCNCPTFSKQNDLIKKGWHVGVIAGAGRLSADADGTDWDSDYWQAGAMTGLDVGVTNLITLTPELRMLYRDALSDDVVTWSPGVDLQLALRCTLRFDTNNYGFRRSRRRR